MHHGAPAHHDELDRSLARQCAIASVLLSRRICAPATRWPRLTALALALLLFGGVLLAGCGERYEHNDLELLTAYRAKELCSCLFVMGRDEGYCRAWTVAAPDLASYRIDWQQRRVETSALMLWSARARHVSAREGCILE